jgi:hypothetical protein
VLKPKNTNKMMHVINWQGVSCGMEAAAVVVIFTHSVDLHVISYKRLMVEQA